MHFLLVVKETVAQVVGDGVVILADVRQDAEELLAIGTRDSGEITGPSSHQQRDEAAAMARNRAFQKLTASQAEELRFKILR